ncbi:HAD-IB family hydrolase [Riemerella anatipestifer]|uniref:HAD family hydrolase n=1 Tax=Riemerella anatipestifer TaxID=34085 RepID=A0A1S7DQ18_RIEAN|nr:HAD-IB family hydrolase [Riemerella anatipestifer]AQY21210.1 HAD family hydrolase [Riemerella anatipestifer]MCO4304564.1 HAD-IB family hydrolase [Riemerella anatipestifer]MCO7353337.1 HAD-IB family hydrolase [Riemerella anatipestifer]MCQ4039976.1 HAD-IB family hydrolase [Riemerella anatipestifer]MCT6761538.1 HAD-IB family hydrolase [Riemerella anatipestifer]
MKKLYLFDFDGTLTTEDTLFLYLKFYNSSKYRIQFLRYIPLFILLKMKLLKAEKVKESFIASILEGESKERIEKKSKAFFEEYYPKLFRTNALEFIEKIDKEKTVSFIVTASLDIWVRPFAEHFGMGLLATEAEFKDGKFTGKFKTKNCNGDEKVKRIKQATEGLKYDKSIAFGDTVGDHAMLKWANEGLFQFFH